MKIKELAKKLRKQLRENILERYDNEEYWDQEIIEEFFQDNGIEDEKIQNKIMEELSKEEQ
jgi:hypothetical protein